MTAAVDRHPPPIFVAVPDPAFPIDARSGAEVTAWIAGLPRPRGILVVSAWWREAMLTRGRAASSPHRRLVAELAADLGSLVGAPAVHALELGDGPRAAIHYMFPSGDVPVLPLALPAGASPRRLFAFGKKLGPLAERGWLVAGLGAITDSPRERAAEPNAATPDWAKAFDGWVANHLADAELDDLFAWRRKGPNARRALSWPAAIDPLFAVAGAASLDEHAVGYPVRGFAYGTQSLRCVQFGR